ncbi:uncharacterized protein LOC144706289 isoform X2 [Wolffia australiana]
MAAARKKTILPSVAVFWDLKTNPPWQMKPYDAAARLKLAASKFGPVRSAAAYGDHLSLSRQPSDPLLDQVCNVCGRRFFHRAKLLNHFKQVHEREQAKRIAKLDSATGRRRIRLAGELTAKMEKFRRAAEARGVVAEEIRRAGFSIGGAIGDDVAAAVRRRAVGCLLVASDDGDLAGVVREAREGGLRTVVVGGDESLKRIADVGFSWREIASGKAAKEAVTVMGRLNDRDLISTLEWTFRPGDDHD